MDPTLKQDMTFAMIEQRGLQFLLTAEQLPAYKLWLKKSEGYKQRIRERAKVY